MDVVRVQVEKVWREHEKVKEPRVGAKKADVSRRQNNPGLLSSNSSAAKFTGGHAG
jgi:hypothetical protein